MAATVMGRELPPPGQAASREGFHALAGPGRPGQRSPWLPFWWTVATLLFVTGLIFCAYAFEDHRMWLWLGAITAFAIVASVGNIYSGLWYPFAFTAISVLVTALLLPETRHRSLDS